MDVHNKSGGFVEEGDLQLKWGVLGLLAYWLAESFDFVKPLRNVCTVYNIYLYVLYSVSVLRTSTCAQVFDQCVALLQATESNP